MKYLIPYTYGFATRAKGFFYKMSFMIIVFIPMFIGFPLTSKTIPSFDYLIMFIIAFTGFYSIYENGYIVNDFFTTRFEDKPVIRLKDKNNNCEKLSEIYKAIRIVYALIACCILKQVFHMEIQNYVICLVILNFVYSLHNFARGKWNIPTIFLLEIMKYISIQSLFLHGDDCLRYSIAIILTFSLERSITYSLQRRLKIKYNEDFARLVYYCLTSIIGAVLYFSTKDYLILFYSLYMLVFRSACFIFTKKYDVSKIRKD